MTTTLYVFGVTSYARLVAAYANQIPGFTVAGFTVDAAFKNADMLDGWPVIAFDALAATDGHMPAVFLAYGYSNMRTRAALYARISAGGFVMPNLLTPASYVAPGVELGCNNIVMPGAVVEHNVRMGDNNTVWSNVTLCHDSTFGSHNFFAANTTVGGHVQMGSRNFLGFSSTVEQYRQLGDENLVGAMSYLHDDATNCQRWLGVPARRAGTHADTGLRLTDPQRT